MRLPSPAVHARRAGGDEPGVFVAFAQSAYRSCYTRHEKREHNPGSSRARARLNADLTDARREPRASAGASRCCCCCARRADLPRDLLLLVYRVPLGNPELRQLLDEARVGAAGADLLE
jgi:hypothetical protein